MKCSLGAFKSTLSTSVWLLLQGRILKRDQLRRRWLAFIVGVLTDFIKNRKEKTHNDRLSDFFSVFLLFVALLNICSCSDNSSKLVWRHGALLKVRDTIDYVWCSFPRPPNSIIDNIIFDKAGISSRALIYPASPLAGGYHFRVQQKTPRAIEALTFSYVYYYAWRNNLTETRKHFVVQVSISSPFELWFPSPLSYSLSPNQHITRPRPSAMGHCVARRVGGFSLPVSYRHVLTGGVKVEIKKRSKRENKNIQQLDSLVLT
jgi:hypothetical protein